MSNYANLKRVRAQTQMTLKACVCFLYTTRFVVLCRLLHPIMPFVTEELWQRLPRRAGTHQSPSIMTAPYPSVQKGWRNEGLEADFAFLQTVIESVRSLRAGIPANASSRCSESLRVACAGHL